MKEFLENWQTWLPLITFLAGWLLPNALVTAFGLKVGKKLPKPIAKLVAEKLDALEQGLMESQVEGNKEITHNNVIKEAFKGTKIDLGLME